MRATLILFGVIVPAATFTIEAITHICANGYFDPVPTVYHMFLVACVPIANLLAVCTLAGWCRIHPAVVFLLNGVAIATSLIYTVAFLPLSFVGVFAVLVYGLGLLPLTPVISLVCSTTLFLLLRRFYERFPSKRDLGKQTALTMTAGGALLAVGLLVCTELWIGHTTVEVSRAALESATERASAVQWLRHWCSKDQLLQLCLEPAYGRCLAIVAGPWKLDSQVLTLCLRFAAPSMEA